MYVSDIVLAAAVLVPLAGAAAVPHIQAREYVPTKLTLSAPIEELRVQPAIDFDTDSCYNVAAIGADGTFAEGMPAKGQFEAGCRDEADMDNSNVYSRRRCNNGACVTIYDYYFEKDITLKTGTGGYRHDIEHVAVWTTSKNNKITYVATSAHGKYSVRDRKDVLFYNDNQGGEFPLVVYHKDGALTHTFRFASKGDVDRPENHKKVFWRSSLVGWKNYPTTQLRDSLMAHAWKDGKKDSPASFAIKDGDENFKKNIDVAKPKGLKFDSGVDA